VAGEELNGIHIAQKGENYQQKKRIEVNIQLSSEETV